MEAVLSSSLAGLAVSLRWGSFTGLWVGFLDQLGFWFFLRLFIGIGVIGLRKLFICLSELAHGLLSFFRILFIGYKIYRMSCFREPVLCGAEGENSALLSDVADM